MSIASSSAAPWPPPPDLASIQELVRNADVEGFIGVHGAPADEYDTEAEELHAVIWQLPSDQITVTTLVPILEAIWRRNLVHDDSELHIRRPALEELSAQISRFFGPEAQPQTRQQ